MKCVRGLQLCLKEAVRERLLTRPRGVTPKAGPAFAESIFLWDLLGHSIARSIQENDEDWVHFYVNM